MEPIVLFECSVNEYKVILQAKILTTIIEYGFLDRLNEPLVMKAIKDELLQLVKVVHELENEDEL
jgi:hypothetical protein